MAWRCTRCGDVGWHAYVGVCCHVLELRADNEAFRRLLGRMSVDPRDPQAASLLEQRRTLLAPKEVRDG